MGIWHILVPVSSRATCGDKHKLWAAWMGTTVPRESSNSSDHKETVKQSSQAIELDGGSPKPESWLEPSCEKDIG
jgi:hypothetical protein